jgi:hypothetical protein
LKPLLLIGLLSIGFFGIHVTTNPKETTMEKEHMEYVIHGKGYGYVTHFKAPQ